LEVLETSKPSASDRPRPKLKRRKTTSTKVAKKKFTSADIDKMSDEELERAIAEGLIDFDEDKI
jgi:hypothetical protein